VDNPYDPRLSTPLTGLADLRKSRVGAWRIIYKVDEGKIIVDVVMIERRGQVYKRL
jgi:mRNA-degrading endonuclease RelE of RelBE toxin-antitoxin system